MLIGYIFAALVAFVALAAFIGTIVILIVNAVSNPGLGPILLAVFSPIIACLVTVAVWEGLGFAVLIVMIPIAWVLTNPFKSSESQPMYAVIGTPPTPVASRSIPGFTGNESRRIVAFCNRRWDLDRNDWREPETADDCRRAEAAGVHVGEGWGWKFASVKTDGGRIVVSIDDGPPIAGADMQFNEAMGVLPPGRHTIRMNEWRGDWLGREMWKGWTAPHSFTVVTDLEIVALRNVAMEPSAGPLLRGWEGPLPPRGSDAAWAGLLRTGQGWGFEYIIYGVVEPEHIVYRVDGWRGADNPSLAGFLLADLPPGPHTIEAREQRPWGWTDWSPPYTFTVR